MKIGVDGGGTKTEFLLLDEQGEVLRRHVTGGTNPNVVGPEAARRIVSESLDTLTDGLVGRSVRLVLLCMAGSRDFWKETAAQIKGCGRVLTCDDSLPALELATGGEPGLVLHGGTGSFVAARAADQHDPLVCLYAGGIGWRFGDAGSGYDIGRRAIGRGLLELQGWAPWTRIGTAIQAHSTLKSAADVTRFFYAHAEPNRIVAALAPAILDLAADGEIVAREIVAASAGELLDLAHKVATATFPDTPLDRLRAGLSGPVLTHRFVVADLSTRSLLRLTPIEDPPIEGVRRLLLRL
jgi:N-acetylglucosamine kinase-like BadF-type ATPase